METLRAKHSIERDVLSAGVGIGTYLSDNGAFTSQDFVKELMEAGQGQRLAGVGGHHQNTCCVFTMQHPLLPSANAFNLLTFWISSARITTALQTAAIAAPYLGLCPTSPPVPSGLGMPWPCYVAAPEFSPRLPTQLPVQQSVSSKQGLRNKCLSCCIHSLCSSHLLGQTYRGAVGT